jgi:serine protease Do
MYDNEIYSNSDSGKYTEYRTDGNVYSGGDINKKEKKKIGGFRKVLISAGMGLAFGLFAGGGFYAVKYGGEQLRPVQNQDALNQGVGQTPGVGNLNGSGSGIVNHVTYVKSDVSDVVEKVMPAMVSIVNNYTETGTAMTIWGQKYNYSNPGTSSGSGIILGENEEELLIVTNNHVVQDTDELQVLFIDGSTAAAVVKGQDADMDLAVIAVKLDSLSEETQNAITVATLGSSDDLKLGAPVIAIGNALGYGQSVTDGIISALNREVTMEDGSKGTFIQTNAAINHGNSGGALLNINGEVIGINSNKIGGYSVEGMGYAIPISSASPIIADLMERQTRTDKVAQEEKGYMGVSMQDVTSQYAGMFGIPQGVSVQEVTEGSPAEQAGIKKYDIIVKFDGQKVSSGAELKEQVEYYRAGETVTITVQRLMDGQYESIDLELTLGSWPQ